MVEVVKNVSIPDMQRVFNEFITRKWKLFIEKNEGYAESTDVFENFRIGATLNNESPESYAARLMSKHFIKLVKMCSRIEEPTEHTNEAEWDEVLGDIVIYSIIIRAMANKRYGKPEATEVTPVEDYEFDRVPYITPTQQDHLLDVLANLVKNKTVEEVLSDAQHN